MANEANIEPHRFQKGQSGNPAGKPVGIKNRSTIARKVLEMKGLIPEKALEKLKSVFPEITNEMTMEEVMTIIQAGKAVANRDTFAYNALLDSAYGKPKQEVQNSGEMTLHVPALPNIQIIVDGKPKSLEE